MKKSFFVLLFVAMFTLVACDNNTNNSGCKDVPPPIDEVAFINNLIEQGKEFDVETIAKGLPGVWKLDSEYMYDEAWQNVTDVIMYKGREYWAGGLVCQQYTFKADGTGQRYVDVSDPDIEPETLNFDWRYEAENKMLILTIGNDWAIIWIVSAISDEYISLDCISASNQNIREVYKLVTDN